MLCLLTAWSGLPAQKRIMKIVNEYGDNAGSSTKIYEFGYDPGNRLTKFSATDYGMPEFDQTITYSDGKVTISGFINESDCTQEYTLNPQGFAESCHMIDGGGKTNDIAFEYADGYLTKMTIIEKYEGGSQSTDTYTFQYTDNNITSATGFGELEIEYGQTSNTCGLPSYLLMDDLLYEHKAALYAGLLGKPCNNLPTKITEDGYSLGFTYELYDDGYVNTMSVKGSDYGFYETYKYSYETCSGVETVGNENVNVTASGNSIRIDGTNGSNVEVYNTSGQLIYNGTATTVEIYIKGIYIVKVSSKIFKVAI